MVGVSGFGMRVKDIASGRQSRLSKKRRRSNKAAIRRVMNVQEFDDQ
jgi:hypothetical protein